MRWGLLSLVTGALLCVASCARIRTQRNGAAALERDNRAEYLYKAFVLNRGFRPAKGYTGVWRTWYENGGKMSECVLARNVRHGICKEWDVEGNLIANGDYRDGKPYEGTFRNWYYIDCDLDKHCYTITSYLDGERHGPYSDWTKSGRKLAQGQHVNGRREYLWIWWDLDGKVLAVGEYRDGRPWRGAFAGYSDDRTKVKHYANGEQVEEPPPFVRAPLYTD